MFSDAKLERRMLRQYHRHAAESSQEGLFGALGAQSQELVLSMLSGDERAVLAVWGSDGRLLVVTTRRLLFIAGQESKAIDVSVVQRATVDFTAEVQRGNRSKEAWRTLLLELNSGKAISFTLQDGPPFWAILNTVKWLVDRSTQGSLSPL